MNYEQAIQKHQAKVNAAQFEQYRKFIQAMQQDKADKQKPSFPQAIGFSAEDVKFLKDCGIKP